MILSYLYFTTVVGLTSPCKSFPLRSFVVFFSEPGWVRYMVLWELPFLP